MLLHAGDSPSIPLLDSMTLSPGVRDCLHFCPLEHISTILPDEEEVQLRAAERTAEALAGMAQKTDFAAREVLWQARMKRQREHRAKIRAAQALVALGQFDALIIACKYHPQNILERTLPLLARSRPFCVFSPDPEVCGDKLGALIYISCAPELLTHSLPGACSVLPRAEAAWHRPGMNFSCC